MKNHTLLVTPDPRERREYEAADDGRTPVRAGRARGPQSTFTVKTP